MQRATEFARPGFGVECAGGVHRVRVEFDDAAQARPMPIDLLDPVQIMPGSARGAGRLGHTHFALCDFRTVGNSTFTRDCRGQQTNRCEKTASLHE
jgi:hypothetical protein